MDLDRGHLHSHVRWPAVRARSAGGDPEGGGGGPAEGAPGG